MQTLAQVPPTSLFVEQILIEPAPGLVARPRSESAQERLIIGSRKSVVLTLSRKTGWI